MKRTNQGGSILSFVIIGGVLVLLLVGSTYAIRHLLMPVSNGSMPVAQEDESTSGTDKSNESSVPKTDEKADTSTPSQTDNTPLPSGSTAPEAQVLPTTGPADVLVSGLMLGSLVALVATYVRSRHELASL